MKTEVKFQPQVPLKHNYQSKSEPYSLSTVDCKINFSSYDQEIFCYLGRVKCWNNVCSLG